MKKHKRTIINPINRIGGKVRAAVRCAAIRKTIRSYSPPTLPAGVRFPNRVH